MARASTIPAGSASHNTSFDISYQLINDAQNIYKFYVTATYGSNLDYTYINDIAFKLDDYSSNSDYSSTPTVVGPAEDSWSVLSGGISNGDGSGDCSGSGGGFWCADSAGFGATHSPVPGTTDTWTFTLDLKNNLADLPQDATGSFKAGFTDQNGNKVGTILSDSVTIHPCTDCGGGGGAVPEPASIFLLGSGLVGLIGYGRRRTHS